MQPQNLKQRHLGRQRGPLATSLLSVSETAVAFAVHRHALPRNEEQELIMIAFHIELIPIMICSVRSDAPNNPTISMDILLIFSGAALALLFASPSSALPNTRTSEPTSRVRTLTSIKTSPRRCRLPFNPFPCLSFLSQYFNTHMAQPFLGPSADLAPAHSDERHLCNTFLGSGARRSPEHLRQHFLRHLGQSLPAG